MNTALRLLTTVTICMSLSACSSTPRSESSSSSPSSDEVADDSVPPSFSGDFLVKGYPTTETIHESFCEDQDCPTYQYVYLNITSNDNQALQDHLKESSDYLTKNISRIGLGCVENNIITYSNDSDEFGLQEQKLSQGLTSSILSATQTTPLALHLVKLPVTNIRVAPVCSSEFTTIEVPKP